MSTPNPLSGGTAVSQYFCYQCNRTVSLSLSTDPLCPLCNSGFIEEVIYNPINNPNPNLFDLFSAATSSPSIDLASLFGTPALLQQQQQPPEIGDDEFNPFAFLQNYLSTLRANGARVQLVIENSDGGMPRAGGGGVNFGDYFVGPGLEQLIQQLAENDPNRYGNPPAAKSAIEALPDVEIDKGLLDSDYSQCAVCKDTFELGDLAKKMPCKHLYHSDCIVPWLELHNSCPVCRFELPTDDPEYENRVREGENSSGGGGGGGEFVGVREERESPRTVERRFRVSLPWPFRAFGGEGSNSGGDGNTGGRSNSEGQAREEDLD